MTETPRPHSVADRRARTSSIGLLRDLITPEVVDPADPRAMRIRGTLLDGAGEPVPDGMVEIWQANAAGRYDHPADDRAERRRSRTGSSASDAPAPSTRAGSSSSPSSRGRCRGPTGGCRRRTSRSASSRAGCSSAPSPASTSPTRQEANAADPVLSRLDEAARATLVAVAEDGGLRFDIRLQGPGQTTFFAV